MFIDIGYNPNRCSWVIKDTEFSFFSTRKGRISAIIDAYEYIKKCPAAALCRYMYLSYPMGYRAGNLFNNLINWECLSEEDISNVLKYEQCFKNQIARRRFIGEIKNVR